MPPISNSAKAPIPNRAGIDKNDFEASPFSFSSGPANGTLSLAD